MMLAGTALREVDRATSEGDAMFAAAAKPLDVPPEWVRLRHRGQAHVFKRRAVCCLAYKAPRWFDGYCTTCPLRPLDRTESRLRDHLDETSP